MSFPPSAKSSKKTEATQASAVSSVTLAEKRIHCIGDLIIALLGIASPGNETSRKQWAQQLGADAYEAVIMSITYYLQCGFETLVLSQAEPSPMPESLVAIDSWVRVEIGCTIGKFIAPVDGTGRTRVLSDYSPNLLLMNTIGLLVLVLQIIMSTRQEITDHRKEEGEPPVIAHIWTAASKVVHKVLVIAEKKAKEHPNMFGAALRCTELMDPELYKFIKTEIVNSNRLEVECKNIAPTFIDRDDQFITQLCKKFRSKGKVEVCMDKNGLRNTADLLAEESKVTAPKQQPAEKRLLPAAHFEIPKKKVKNGMMFSISEDDTNAPDDAAAPDTAAMSKAARIMDHAAKKAKTEVTKTSKTSTMAENAQHVANVESVTKSSTATTVKPASLKTMPVKGTKTNPSIAPLESSVAKPKSDTTAYHFNGYPLSTKANKSVCDSLKTEVIDKSWTRKQTSGEGDMCGLYAAATTLSNMIREQRADDVLGNTNGCAQAMIKFFRSEEFQAYWIGCTDQVFPMGDPNVGDAANTYDCLVSVSNLGLNIVTVCVAKFVECMVDSTSEWGIGVITVRSENGKNVICPYSLAAADNARLVWIWSNQPAGESSDRLLNHFQGLGPRIKKGFGIRKIT